MNALLFNLSAVYDNLELILVLAFLSFALYGYVRGFFAQLGGSISTMVALIVAVLFSKLPFAFIQNNTSVCQSAKLWISSGVESMFPALSNLSTQNVAAEVSTLPFPDIVKDTIVSYATKSGQSVVNLNDYVSTALADYLVLALCFALTFFAVKTLFLILKIIGEKLRKYEAVRKADSLLGAFISCFKLFRKLSFALFIIYLLPFNFLGDIKQAVANSVIATFIKDYNLFEWLLSLAQLR